MTHGAFLAVIASAILAQLAGAQNINTTGLPGKQPANNGYQAASFGFGSCDFESLFVRTLDGSCNNINHPSWGQSGGYFYRGPEGAQYAPGTTSDFWQTVDSRVISNTIANDGQPVSPVGSSSGNQLLSDLPVNLFGVFFGQWVNHDLEYNKVSVDRVGFANVTDDWLFFCTGTNFYNPLNDCFERSSASVGDVVNGQLEIISKNNAWLDLSVIYSDNQTQANALRTHVNGTLRLRNWNADGGAYANFTTVIRNTLISQADTNGVVDSDIAALPPMDPQYLMVSGDARASEDIPLTVLHTVFAREHNYQAARYQKIYPSATDEQLFQLARRFTIAEYQKIVYEEYIPATIGALPKYTGYKSTVNAGTSTAFAAGAFRYGHSTSRDFDIYDGCSPQGASLLQINDDPNMFSFLNTTISGTRLLFEGQIFVLGGVQGTTAYDYEPARIIALMGGRHGDGFDNLISSLIRQRSGKFDPIVANTLRNIVGVADLLSTDIFRGRSNGLPNYNTLRTYYHPSGSIYKNPACKLSAAVDSNACWAVLTSNSTIAAGLKSLYGKVNQVDALVGMFAENVDAGAYLGPTTIGIMADEFTRKRDGDRFFYENSLYYFKDEISLIKSTSFVTILERNTGLIGLPANVFLTNEGKNTGNPQSAECTI